MIDTASDPKYFTFIRDCYPDIKPVLGDARLTFAKEPDGLYDLIVVDAYSSDAIPIHLATREAMEIYKQKLAPEGVVLMHVSNRHLELSSVVVGIADANGLKSWVFSEDANRDGEYIFSTTVVLSARDEADIGKLATDDNWTLTEAEDATDECGRTTTPTSSARCCADSGTGRSRPALRRRRVIASEAKQSSRARSAPTKDEALAASSAHCFGAPSGDGWIASSLRSSQ